MHRDSTHGEALAMTAIPAPLDGRVAIVTGASRGTERSVDRSGRERA
ncbi:MAG TPA: hypothetical protein VGF32_02600 [Streptosporangiaceae bacterium]